MKKILKLVIVTATVMFGMIVTTQTASADYFTNARTFYDYTPVKSRGYWESTKSQKIPGGFERYVVKISKKKMTSRYMVHQNIMGTRISRQDHPMHPFTEFGWGKAGHKSYWVTGEKYNVVKDHYYDLVTMRFTFTGRGYKHLTIKFEKTNEYPKTMHLKKISKATYQKAIREY
ncbi:hypothetical protein ACS4N0_10775 [Levilactobacillus zymae]|uniref:hypothetical protein n=1 Tax=Levilactobacillus zymae TaxID=267363 RepID=UPI000B402337